MSKAGSALPPKRLAGDAGEARSAACAPTSRPLAKRLERERPLVRRAAFRAYDQYLKINRVEDGVTSYSRALSLILGSPFRDALAQYRVSRDPQPR